MCTACGHEHKADPYGRDKPSKLPNPAKPGGERVPKPGLPAEYPSYLKPIPVNTRNIEKELRAYTAKREPKLRRILYSTWNAEKEAIKYQELRNAVRDREVPKEWIERWRQDYSAMVNGTLEPTWREGIAKGSKEINDSFAKRIGFHMRFDQNATDIENWIQTRGGEMAVNLSDEQHEAMRNVIRHLVVDEGMGPEQLGRYIRPIIGLTPKEEAAVRKYMLHLRANGEGFAQAIHKVENYSAFLHRRRALRIARTETSFAFNFGGIDQMRQAVAEGTIRDPVAKQFLTAKDEKVCELCGGMNGRIVGLEETWPGGTARMPNTLCPPLHPLCRCTELFVILAVMGNGRFRNPDTGEEVTLNLAA